MGKRLTFCLLISLFFVSLVRAGYSDSSDIIDPGKLSAGLNFNLVKGPGFAGDLNVGIGAAKWGSVYLRTGYGGDYSGTNGFFIRSYLKILLTRTMGGVDHVALSLGPEFHNDIGIYCSVIACTAHKNFQFYTGLDQTLYFKDSELVTPFHFLIGTKIRNRMNFMKLGRFSPALIMELGVPLSSNTAYNFSLSINYDLDFKVVEIEE